ncbi:MAG: 50S ribosomal protein L6, partial [Candidatus ainarchaeum sp.]|nr:50S ribosomal protein L6 [Candidatus ainarchaeum sp.]
VKGTEKEFEYHLRGVYSHFPINIAVKGANVEVNNFLGEKRARIAKIMPGAKVEIKGKEVFVRGFDKDAVGQTAANIEARSRVSNRDRRVFQDGIFLVEKS